MTSEIDRLRRELRALAAVNHQLQAQREEPVAVRTDRRATVGIEWIEQLATIGASDAHMARAPDGSVFVVEDTRRRPVSSGLLAAGLEAVLGPAHELTGEEVESLTPGVAVEIFEASAGPPFVVVGGRRCNIRGLPLPYPVDRRHASEFPEGDEINIAAANVARRRFEEAVDGSLQVDRLRRSLTSRGPVATSKAVARKLGRRFRGATPAGS